MTTKQRAIFAIVVGLPAFVAFGYFGYFTNVWAAGALLLAM